jgi:hypothetical protein
MKHPVLCFAATLLISGLATGAAAATYEGTLEGGAKWAVETPPAWNGVLVTFGNPRAEINKALLVRGYGVGTMIQRPGIGLRAREWANDQLAALREIHDEVGPKTVITVGYSGPGLVNAMVSEDAGALTQGAVIGCALNVGLRNLFNVHLDGAHALSVLLMPDMHPKLVNFKDEVEIDTQIAQIRAVAMQAQRTAEGRARIALVGGFGMMPTWFDPASPPPAAGDYDAQEVAQFNHLTALNTMGFDGMSVAGGAKRPPGGWPGVTLGGNLSFTVYSRFDMERLAGGNISSNAGVDYAKLFRDLPTRAEVEALYNKAGLDLAADLKRLTAAADIEADPLAANWIEANGSVTGQLRIPTLSIRSISDIAGPQYDSWYADRARDAGSAALLRQTYVQHVGHCSFRPAEVVAAVFTVQARIEKGDWGSSVAPQAIQALAISLDLGKAAFIPFAPGKFVSDRERAP